MRMKTIRSNILVSLHSHNKQKFIFTSPVLLNWLISKNSKLFNVRHFLNMRKILKLLLNIFLKFVFHWLKLIFMYYFSSYFSH